jgi:hypothetical protein
MANTKKNVEKKDVVEEVVVTEEFVEEAPVVAKPKKAKPKHDPDELIDCRSMVFGELMLIGPKTRMRYSWANEGDVRPVEYQDLVSWRALHSKYLFAPFIIIEDEDLCEEWKVDLGPIYDKLQDVNLKDIFNMPHRQFVTQLKQLPETMKSSMQNMAYAMIQDGSLYDLRKIKAMDEILGTELTMMI